MSPASANRLKVIINFLSFDEMIDGRPAHLMNNGEFLPMKLYS
jgi:hypothetical protein